MSARASQHSRDPVGLRTLAGAYRLSQAVAAAARIGIGDALANGPRDSDSVARGLGAHPPTLHRLMRALAGEGVLREDQNGRFALTALGECLRSDDPDGTRAMILGWSCLEQGYLAFSRLHDTVMTGRSGFELTFGEPFHSYLESHPDVSASYGAATDSTVESFQEAIAAYNFSSFSTIVDVGGGSGVLLTCLLRAYPDIRGVLFELPAVIERTAIPEDVADRIECVPGNALSTVPVGGDAYVFSTVLRCFDDRQCVALLKACRQSMHDNSRLLALEMVIPPGPAEPLRGLADLQALINYGGGDRDQETWIQLMAQADLHLQSIQPADGPYSWLTATRT